MALGVFPKLIPNFCKLLLIYKSQSPSLRRVAERTRQLIEPAAALLGRINGNGDVGGEFLTDELN
jgi:hypothetical protein